MTSQNFIYEVTPLADMLVRTVSDSQQLVNYQMEILVRHKPDFLLPCILRFRQGHPQICLDATGLSPIDHAYMGENLIPGNGHQILAILLRVLIEAEDRMLPIEQFSLLPSTIFFNPDQQIQLSFWPLKTVDNSSDGHPQRQGLISCLHSIGSAFKIPEETIMSYQNCLKEKGLTDLYEQVSEKAAEMTDTLKKAVNKDDGLKNNIGTCFRLLVSKIRTMPPVFLIILNISIFAIMAATHRIAPGWPFGWKLFVMLIMMILLGFNAIRLSSVQRLVRNKDQPEEKSLSQNSDMDHQTVLISTNPADFRMALLAEGKPGTPEENEGIRAYILIDEFIVGRDHKACDLCLTEPEIGRQHARITRREGSFFLCDLGSRNGTCLNGRRLLKNVESLLPDQCLIKFAERQFYFQAD